MPRGYYGRAAARLNANAASAPIAAPAPVAFAPAPQTTTLIGAEFGEPSGGGAKWGLVAAAAVAGVVVGAMVTTPFHGRKKKSRSVSSPFRSIY